MATFAPFANGPHINLDVTKSERAQLLDIAKVVFHKDLGKLSVKQLVAKFEKALMDEESLYLELCDEIYPDVNHIETVNVWTYPQILAAFINAPVDGPVKQTKRNRERKTDRTIRPRKRLGMNYQEFLKTYFAERDSASRAELLEIMDTDARNLHVAVSILKNPARTKEPMVLVYDKATQVFTKQVLAV